MRDYTCPHNHAPGHFCGYCDSFAPYGPVSGLPAVEVVVTTSDTPAHTPGAVPESETPRTDAALQKAWDFEREWVSPDLARTLERELAALKEELRKEREENERLRAALAHREAMEGNYKPQKGARL